MNKEEVWMRHGGGRGPGRGKGREEGSRQDIRVARVFTCSDVYPAPPKAAVGAGAIIAPQISVRGDSKSELFTYKTSVDDGNAFALGTFNRED